MPQTIADGLQGIINAKSDIDGAIAAKGGIVTKGLVNTDDDIMTIPSGGGGGSSGTDVVFYDYDGTIVQSYSAEEFADISSLPDNPTHTGLTAQGWNWSLSDAKTYVATYGKLNIGQMYITSDGKTRIYINLPEGRISPVLMLYLNANTELDIDWGDGSTHSTLTSTSANFKSKRHTYPDKGEYVIAITVVNGSFVFQSQTLSYNTFFTDGKNSTTSSDRAYCYSLSSISISDSITTIGDHAFYNSYSLSSISISDSVTTIGSYAFAGCSALSSMSIPDSVTSIGQYALQYCYALSSITIPNSITSIQGNTFYFCSALSSITIPDGVTSIGYAAFQGCYSLSSITISSSVTSIGAYAFGSCYSLSSVTIPDSVTTIGSNAFNNCNSMDYIRFIGTTPPTVQGSNAWTSVSTSTIIYIPAESINAYRTATNYPNPSTYKYVGYATYASGDPLPSTIPGYSLTWYATIEDWIADTNPITVGNGNEVYAKPAAVTSITRETDFVNNVTTRSTDAIEALNVYRNMKRCNVADDGTINAFIGDVGYTEDGSNGQVMVYVPKFYYKTNHTNSDGTSTANGTGIDIGKWSIADTKLDNTFNLHPAFIGTDGTTELDYFLIGAFEAIAYDGTSYLDQTNIGTSTSYKLSSVGYVSGSPTYRPAHAFTRAVGRASAQRRGTGWYQIGFKQISAIQMLFTVELSCNSQKAVGYGITTLGTQTAFSDTSYVGSTVGNITGNATSTKNSNGTTYTTNGDVSVSYRGIENLWGNIWCWIDGLTMNGYTPYVNTSYTFTDDTTVGTQLAYNVPQSNNYQTKFGYDSSMDWVMLPYSSGAESDPNNAVIGDYVYVSSASNRVALLGGAWYDGSRAGFFCWVLYYGSSNSNASVGSRIMFIP